MRILYINYEWDLRESSGAAAHLHELSAGLGRLGHEVVRCERRRHQANGPMEHGAASRPKSRRERLSRYLHEAHALLRAVVGIREEIAILERERPDVVLTRYSLHQFSSLVAARRRGIPIVFEVNAPATYEYRRYQPRYKLIPGLGEAIEVGTFRRSDGIFVVSASLKRYFVERGIADDHIAVIPNAADPALFTPDAADPTLRGSYGARDVVVSFVGSFSGFHGIETLKHIISEVIVREPDARFLLVGEGSRSNDLREFCATHGFGDRVRFTGHVPRERVPSLMATADILVAPYEADEFFYFSPIKIFEYMASGRAILAARLGQIAEVVRDGVDGMLYNPADPDDLVAKLLDLIHAPTVRTRLGRAAREAVEQRYSWDVNASRVAALLENAIIKPHRKPTQALSWLVPSRRG